jgi:hypothetical protein
MPRRSGLTRAEEVKTLAPRLLYLFALQCALLFVSGWLAFDSQGQRHRDGKATAYRKSFI